MTVTRLQGYSKYFKDRGIDTVDPAYYNKINTWDSWYKSNVPRFHRYSVYRGAGSYVRCKRRSLGMAKKLCEDIADLLLNERVRISFSDEATGDYVRSVLRSSNFAALGNAFQERKAALGTVAYVPTLTNVQADEDGNIISADVRINYVTATHIFPTRWQNGRTICAVFAIEARHKRRVYTMMQSHDLVTDEDGARHYVITNTVIDNAGNVIPFERWQKIPAFCGLVECVDTGSDQPQFAIDTLAITNNATDDESNPLGIPVFANAIDVLEKLDIEYDSYVNEFLLGRKRLFVAPEMLQDVNGNLVFDPNDSVFYQLPEDYLKGSNDPIKEVNMDIRGEEHEAALNHDLNLLSLKCGLGTQYYRFERGSVATATQVISENSDLYRTIRKHEIPLAETLRTLFRAIIRLGIVSGVPDLDPDSEILIDFDDSIIEDKGAEREQDRQDVELGAMSLTEYRAKWYGETPEVAATKVVERRASQ